MENLKTYEDCCLATGRDPKVLHKVFNLLESIMPKAVSDCKLNIVIEAINKSVPPDWSNPNEWKYYPLFRVVEDKSKPSGFGLSYNVCANTYSDTVVGSRLTFRTVKGLKYAVKQFPELYEEVYL